MKAIYLSVIVPVYNEALTIGETIRKLREFLEAQSYSWELIICDDGSTDGTSKMFNDEVKNVEHIRALSLPHRGKGATVRVVCLTQRANSYLCVMLTCLCLWIKFRYSCSEWIILILILRLVLDRKKGP